MQIHMMNEKKNWGKILAIVHFVINNLKFIRQRLNHVVKINTELIQDNGTVCINCGSQQHYATVYNEYINFRDPICKIKKRVYTN